MDSDEELTKEFNKSAEKIKSSGKTFSNDILYELYGYYKQSTLGDCNTKCPSFFQFIEKSKWESWNKHKGMKKSHAMKKYIKLVNELLSK